MAYRRILTSLTRQSPPFFLKTPKFPPSLLTLIPSSQTHLISPLEIPQFNPFSSISRPPNPDSSPNQIHPQNSNNDENDDDDDDDDDDEDEEDYISDEEDDEEEIDGNVGKANVIEPACFEKRSYCVKEKIEEAADIGYKVVGPLVPGDQVFNRFELAFAVVQVGSHQFKVSNGDCIYVEKLKYCEVNDKLILNKVLMVGSPTQTIIGRPILPEAAVHAVVEEHALDAKVIIFKKKRRKNYRRTKGHRQELTRLRITDIQGIEKPEAPSVVKTAKSPAKKTGKVAVAA